MIAHQVPLSMGFFQARILEQVAISFSREPPCVTGVELLSLLSLGGVSSVNGVL